MTRKRSGKTLVQQMTQTCPICKGSGFIKSLRTESYLILRAFKEALRNKQDEFTAVISINPEIFHYLTSHEYNAILALEKETGHKIELYSKEGLGMGTYKIEWDK